MCIRLTERCEQLNMDILSVIGDGHVIFFQWKMQMIFRRFPSSPVYGASKLTLSDDGRIIEQRDYFDLWGDIFENVPVMKKLYPRFMRRLFG